MFIYNRKESEIFNVETGMVIILDITHQINQPSISFSKFENDCCHRWNYKTEQEAKSAFDRILEELKPIEV